MAKSRKPLVRIDILVTEDDIDSTNPIPVGSPTWYAWLAKHEGFLYKGGVGQFSARREMRRGIGYWYGYRRRNGKLSKTYLGRSEDLTQARLEQASALLAGQLPLNDLVSGGSTELAEGRNFPAATVPVPTETSEEIPFTTLAQLKPPALPQGLIARQHLTQMIQAPVNILCAPSGFGKTTLLNDWRLNSGIQMAWVTLDAGDNHPQRFWSKVVLALQTIHASFGQGWFSQLGSAYPSDLSRIVVNLINDIVRVSGASPALRWIGVVLDNYHFVQNPEIHTSLQTLLEHIPAALKLVVASHTKPPLALGYLKAKGMVVELGVNDLRFTLEEGIAFLRQHRNAQHLAYADMQALVERTEGWITGLVLATSALSRLDDRASLAKSFTGSHPLLREFFCDSVLCQLSPELQTFLIKTSILKTLSGPLCDAITGQSDSAEMLARLWDAKLFIEQLDEPDWFKYHGLFAGMLNTLLQEQFPAEIHSLHYQAATWYRTRNAPLEVIHHLLAAEAWEEAAALIDSVALQELSQLGEDSRLLRFIQKLPVEILQQHKIIFKLYLRLARIAFSPTRVEDLFARVGLKNATASSADQTAAAVEMLAEIQQLRDSRAESGRGTEKTSPDDETNPAWVLLDGILLCYHDYRRDLIQAERTATAVYEHAQSSRHLYAMLIAGGGCANLALSQGHLRQSEQIAQQVLRQAYNALGRLPGPASIALTALSDVYFMHNQLAQAHQLLVRATEVDANPASTNGLVAMAILRAKIQSAQGDNEAAYTTIQAIRELHAERPSSIWFDQDLSAYQGLFRLRLGDVASAERFLDEGGEIETNAFSALAKAEILVEQKRSVAAEDMLNRLLSHYPHGSYMLPVLRARVMLAVALFEQGKVTQARQVMTEAARLAAPEYFIRPFLDYAPKIVPLFSLILSSKNLGAGIQSFLRGILTMSGYARDIPRIHSLEEPVELAIAASITPREQDILRMMSLGLSNREIAERYSISTSTVNTHIENIFRKLEVNNRTQAIAKWQMLNLV